MNFRLGVAKPRISVKEGDLRMKVRVLSFECKAFLSIPRSKQKLEKSRINSTKGEKNEGKGGMKKRGLPTVDGLISSYEALP